jgi:hypothetical protein
MEPPGPQPAKALREGEFVVIAKAREEPGGGIAKTLAGVAAPRRCRGKRRYLRAIRSREFALELLLAPFRAPAELAGGARTEFGSKQVFPTPARLIRQSRPGEMKDFMDQDALEIAGSAQGLRIDQNETPWDGGRGKMGTEGAAKLHSNGLAGQGRQWHFWFLSRAYGFGGCACFGSGPLGRKNSGLSMTGVKRLLRSVPKACKC